MPIIPSVLESFWIVAKVGDKNSQKYPCQHPARTGNNGKYKVRELLAQDREPRWRPCRRCRTLVVGLGNATYNSVEFREIPPRKEASSISSSGLVFG
jgi:hypothetical protein